ncbi:metal-dependent hydrolase [Halorussus halophilus]|uniref:metal-dependent hydrolase n=1 Tax=Halorussus halophilus TaxID=2650975 RepID=UPI0013011A3D|nr:metal-dependent hydrolase [Halorussus halophilus]
MFRLGHYGVALLLYAPVGGWLLTTGNPSLAILGGAAVLWLTMVPDLDVRVPFVSHRGPTHTLPFVGGVAALVWFGGTAAGLGSVALGPTDVRTFAAGVVALSLSAHLLADVLTPMGVAVLWPLSGERYSLSVAPADSTLANYSLFALGVAASAATLFLGVT